MYCGPSCRDRQIIVNIRDPPTLQRVYQQRCCGNKVRCHTPSLMRWVCGVVQTLRSMFAAREMGTTLRSARYHRLMPHDTPGGNYYMYSGLLDSETRTRGWCFRQDRMVTYTFPHPRDPLLPLALRSLVCVSVLVQQCFVRVALSS